MLVVELGCFEDVRCKNITTYKKNIPNLRISEIEVARPGFEPRTPY